MGYDSRLEIYQLEIAGADEARVDQVVADLNTRPEVEFAAPRFGSVGVQPAPNDAEYPPGSWGAGSQERRNWGLRHMQLPEAWDIAQGSVLVPLTVIDNGFMANHPDCNPISFSSSRAICPGAAKVSRTTAPTWPASPRRRATMPPAFPA